VRDIAFHGGVAQRVADGAAPGAVLGARVLVVEVRQRRARVARAAEEITVLLAGQGDVQRPVLVLEYWIAAPNPRKSGVSYCTLLARRRWKLPEEFVPSGIFERMLLFDTKLPLDTPRNDRVSP
jgi:hypothetical protein